VAATIPARFVHAISGRRLLVLKVVLSTALLVFLVRSVDVGESLRLLPRVQLPLLLLGVAINWSALLLQGLRWQVLLRPFRLRCGVRTLTALVLVGVYYGNFLPGGISGDAARTFGLTRRLGNRVPIAASVTVDRLLGAQSLSLIACAALLLAPSGHVTFVSAGFVALALTGLIVLLVSGLVTRLAGRIVPLRVLSRFTDVCVAYSHALATLGRALGVSLAFHLLVVASLYLYALSLGIVAPPMAFLSSLTLTLLASLLPLSFSGIGVQDAGLIVLLGDVGVSPAAALSLSLLMHLTRISFAVVGCLLSPGLLVADSHLAASEPA
jgi:uncharacterized protein (TIRG00374 family)